MSPPSFCIDELPGEPIDDNDVATHVEKFETSCSVTERGMTHTVTLQQQVEVATKSVWPFVLPWRG